MLDSHVFTLEELLADAPPPCPHKPLSWEATDWNATWHRQRSARTKVCSRCRVRLPADDACFGRDSYRLDGLRSECRTCRKPARV